MNKMVLEIREVFFVRSHMEMKSMLSDIREKENLVIKQQKLVKLSSTAKGGRITCEQFN